MFNLFKRKPKPDAYDLLDANGSSIKEANDLRAADVIDDTQRVGVYELTETGDAPAVQPAVLTNDTSNGAVHRNGTSQQVTSHQDVEVGDDAALDASVSASKPTIPVQGKPHAVEPTNEDVPVTRVAATRPNADQTPVIAIRGMTKVYTMGDMEVRALNGVDLDILPGEMIAIMGPSGSGKSTLMNMLGCLDVPSGGTYLLDGTDVRKLNDNQLADIRGRKLGFVFQSFNLLSRTTAIANVELPLIYAGGRAGQRRKRAAESLGLVGLGDRLDHKPNELSGGQQQRVAIARALINQPKMILADEPTGNLDTRTSTEIMELFQRLNKEQGITVVFVTHDVETAEYCQRVIHIRDGVIERDERK